MPALWLPCTQMQHLEHNPPLEIHKGRGVYLYDAVDNKYIDAISSWWVNIHGHCNTFINDKIKQQLDILEHTLLASVVHPSIVELAEQLVALAPPLLTKAFFADSGSASIECALKMSLQYWHQTGKSEKSTFVSLEHGYHGETLGSLAVTDIPLFSKQYAPLLVQHLRIPSPADIFCPTDDSQQEHEQKSLNHLEELLIKKHHEICALICEPLVQGACGMGMYSTEYLKKAYNLCQKYHVHFIADEIATGFGRTGTMFACEQADISPDFLCLSKGLTAGYLPMSCVLTSDTIYNAFLDDDPQNGLAKGFLHSHSFTGNPLAATAGLASLVLFKNNNLIEKNNALIAHMYKRLQELKNLDFIRDCRQQGMIVAFTVTSPNMLGRNIHVEALKYGVLIRPIGNHIYFMPPYCITIEEIDTIFDVTIKSINTVMDLVHTEQLTNQDIDPKLLA